MKLSGIVLSAIMLIGLSAHADLRSEFEQADRKARTLGMEQQRLKEQRAQEKIAQLRAVEIRQKLISAGMDAKTMVLELSTPGLKLCGTGGCSAFVETYHAKSGNVICEIRYTVEDKDYKKDISLSCYDSLNPQPNITNNIEFVSQ